MRRFGWFILTIALYGVGHSAGNPTYGAVIGDIFSGQKIGLIFGFLEVSFGLGSAFGSWIGGYLFDATGSYAWAFTVCICLFHDLRVWQSTPACAGTPVKWRINAHGLTLAATMKMAPVILNEVNEIFEQIESRS